MANINYNDLAMDIYKFCYNREMWEDVAVYFDGKALASWSEWNGESGMMVGDGLYAYANKNVMDYLQYANPDGLSVSFEGNLHDLVNDFGISYPSTYKSFCKIFEQYGLYFELGSTYYLTTAEL